MARNYGSFTPARDDVDERQNNDDDDDDTHALRKYRSRNERFDTSREPFRDKQELQLQDDQVTGAFWFMNPTHATFTYLGDAESVWDDQGSEEHISNQDHDHDQSSSHSPDVEHRWTTRNNRKGRHALVVHQRSEYYNTPHSTTGFTSVLNGIWRMFTRFAFWDISYLTAISFTIAVAILLVNAVLSVLPYADPSVTLPDGITYVEGALTLTGCLFFLFSSFLNFIEAVNSKTQGCFGWKQERSPDSRTADTGTERGSRTRMVPDWDCVHRRSNYSNLFSGSNNGQKCSANDDSTIDHRYDTNKSAQNESEWKFFPGLKELREHFIYDLGFVTCAVLLCSSAVYCGAALASFITILQTGAISPWVRVPQIIAGIGFTTSSVLFMLETQTKWLVPEIRAIGWQISFWNFLGSIGFTLCAIFALASAQAQDTWSEHQMAYSYLWGSSGFLFGSLLQWYESLDKHPVEYKEREG